MSSCAALLSAVRALDVSAVSAALSASPGAARDYAGSPSLVAEACVAFARRFTRKVSLIGTPVA